MATAFFPSGPGRIVQFNDSFVDGSLIPLKMDNPITFQEHRSIVTRLNGQPKVNFQLMHTVGNTVYANIFGDRSSPLTISGLSAARGCDNNTQHGIELALQWYSDFRASNYQRLIRIMIGQHGFDALLVGFPFDIADAESGVVNWTAELISIPEKR